MDVAHGDENVDTNYTFAAGARFANSFADPESFASAYPSLRDVEENIHIAVQSCLLLSPIKRNPYYLLLLSWKHRQRKLSFLVMNLRTEFQEDEEKTEAITTNEGEETEAIATNVRKCKTVSQGKGRTLRGKH